MKKVLLVFGVLLFGSFSVFAFNYYGEPFKDDAKLADWAKTPVYKMKDAGVISGYADGNFGPDNYVTRAELATMLARYSDGVVNKNIYQFVFALDRTGFIDLNLKGKDKNVQAALIVAEAGYFMMDKPPAGYKNGKLSEGFEEGKEVDVPEGYTYFHESPYEFYLRYKGMRYVGQDNMEVDEWFGPFSDYDGAYLR